MANEQIHNISLFAIGLNDTEIKLLHGIVKLSQRREPHIVLLPKEKIASANVVLVKQSSLASTDMDRLQQFFTKKAVLWIDGTNIAPHHVNVSHPVQWSQLPFLLKKAIKQKKLDGSASSTPQPAQKRQDLAPEIPSIPTPEIQQDNNNGQKNILVVDDSLAVRQHLASILSANGYNAVVAESGLDAMNVFNPEKIDCVLMDVIMPELDGYEACRKIKNLVRGKAETPVIMLTSKSSPFDKIRGKMAGCDSYLTKPVKLSDLKLTLEKSIGQAKHT